MIYILICLFDGKIILEPTSISFDFTDCSCLVWNHCRIRISHRPPKRLISLAWSKHKICVWRWSRDWSFIILLSILSLFVFCLLISDNFEIFDLHYGFTKFREHEIVKWSVNNVHIAYIFTSWVVFLAFLVGIIDVMMLLLVFFNLHFWIMESREPKVKACVLGSQ